MERKNKLAKLVGVDDHGYQRLRDAFNFGVVFNEDAARVIVRSKSFRSTTTVNFEGTLVREKLKRSAR